MFVDPLFDIGQQVRRVLDLVEDDRRGIHLQESARIRNRRRAHVGRFQ